MSTGNIPTKRHIDHTTDPTVSAPKRRKVSFGTVHKVTVEPGVLHNKQLINEIGVLYEAVLAGGMYFDTEEHEVLQGKIITILHEVEKTESTIFNEMGIGKDALMHQVRHIVDALKKQEELFSGHILRDNPEGVNQTVEWIISEANKGVSVDAIKDKCRFSSQEREAIMFQIKHVQRKEQLTEEEVALLAYVLDATKENSPSKTDKVLFELIDNSPQKAMKHWKNGVTIETLKSRVDVLGFENIAQFKSLYTKIEQIEVLSKEIANAYESMAQDVENKYTRENITRIAAAIILEVPGHAGEQGKIKIDLGDRKLQTLFYDSKTGDVYILHKKRGKVFSGLNKTVKTVTKVNVHTLKAAQYVQLLAHKRNTEGIVSTHQFTHSQAALQKEMLFLKDHNVKGEFYLEAHKVIAYETMHDGSLIEKVTIMVPQYSGDALDFADKCTFREAALVMRNTIFAVAGFHEKRLIHFDVKLENLLIMANKDGVIEKCALVDYDSSCAIPEGTKRRLDRLYGTAECAAPEVLLKNHPSFVAVNMHCDFHTFEQFDSFAAGVALYEIMFNTSFWGLEFDYEKRSVINSGENLRENAGKSLELLDSTIRETEEFAEREFLLIIKGLLDLDPKKRMSAMEAKEKILEIEERYGKEALYSFTG